jgi:uncharacterized Zn-binding protein involved in type VI secretion
MKPVARINDTSIGHNGFPSSIATSGSTNVFVNGRGALRVTDSFTPHSKTEGDNVIYHNAIVSSSGSPSVFVNGKPLCRVGDNLSCGDTVGTGSGNVNSN